MLGHRREPLDAHYSMSQHRAKIITAKDLEKNANFEIAASIPAEFEWNGGAALRGLHYTSLPPTALSLIMTSMLW